MFETAVLCLTITNLVLLLGLGIIYIQNLCKVRAVFTIGLLLFAAILFVQNAVSLYMAITEMQTFAMMAELHVLILTGMQTAALIVLNIISWR